jgi:leucine dehydrogenase
MTYKAAVAGLDQGGGKAVIIGDPQRDKSPALFRSFGRFVEQLGGRYITAEDVGTSVADLGIVATSTEHVAGLAELSGDPSPATAWGVFHGIRAAVSHRLGKETLEGVSVAVQGVGHVGYYLCQYLAEAGAVLTIADIDNEAVRHVAEQFSAHTVSPDKIHDANVDVFAPCAMGAVINDETMVRLKATIVAGSANNQLAADHHGNALAAKGILYAPDYVINAGGIINISHERPAYDQAAAWLHTAKIHDTLKDLFRKADAAGMSPETMADKMAEARLFNARQTNRSVAA